MAHGRRLVRPRRALRPGRPATIAAAFDSNVLVYAFDRDAGSKFERAREIVLSGRASGASVTIQALCELYNVLTRRRKRTASEANAAVSGLIANLRIIEPNASDVARGMHLHEIHGVSFWDAMMLAVAARGGCTSLITEDLQDRRRFSAIDAGRSIRIVNPFDEANRDALEAEGLRS